MAKAFSPAACQRLFDKLVDRKSKRPQFAMVVLHLRTVPSSAAGVRLCGLRFALCPRGFGRFAASDEQYFLARWAYFAASPTGRALRAPHHLPSSIRNGRPASSHRAVFGGPVFRLCGLRFALCPRGFSRFAASDESSTPLLIGLTTACFRHRRRPSCAPLRFFR